MGVEKTGIIIRMAEAIHSDHLIAGRVSVAQEGIEGRGIYIVYRERGCIVSTSHELYVSLSEESAHSPSLRQ